MTQRKLHMMALAVIALSTFGSVAQATIYKVEVPVAGDEVRSLVTADEEHTPCFGLEIEVPDAVLEAKLLWATITFHADVTASPIDEWVNDTPIFELFAVSEAADSLDVTTLADHTAAERAVRIGQDRRIVFDIAEIVKAWARAPGVQRHVVFGSFRGGREGALSLRTGVIGAGQVAVVTFVYQTSR